MKRFVVLATPRSGSGLLCSYLRNHEKIKVLGELLNDEETYQSSNMLKTIDEMLEVHGLLSGFKIHLEQIQDRNLSLAFIFQRLSIDAVIIVWREAALDQYASLEIAHKTGIWSAQSPSLQESIKISRDKFLKYYNEVNELWRAAVEELGQLRIPFVDVVYEELASHPQKTMQKVWEFLNVNPISLETDLVKQNPAPISKKVVNWTDIEQDQILKFNLRSAIVPQQLIPESWWPTKEPRSKPGGWTFRVAEPFIPGEAKDNVISAVIRGEVSSASSYVRLMSRTLKGIFNVPTAQPCCNGFAALVLAMQCAKIGPSDLVLVPAFTMVAVANAVMFTGAMPVFVDNAESQYNPEPEDYLTAAGRLTTEEFSRVKAVIVAHTYGVPADIQRLQTLCTSRNWILIEDISECLGITHNGKHLGTFGDFGCGSLYANKIVTAGDGGLIISKHPFSGPRLLSLVNHGFVPPFHFIHTEPCINGKIAGLAAALAVGSLEHMEEVLQHRSQLAAWYRKYLTPCTKYLKLMPPGGDRDTPWVFGVVCGAAAARDELREFMAVKYGIETRNFFPSLERQPAFRNLPSRFLGECTQARQLGVSGCYFPSHFYLKESDIKLICSVVQQFFFQTTTCFSAPSYLPAPTAAMSSITGEITVYGAKCPEDSRLLRKALTLNEAIASIFCRERWDEMRTWQLDFLNLLQSNRLSVIPAPLLKKLRSALAYIELSFSKDWFLPVSLCAPPWEHYELASGPETSTQAETQKLLCWLVRTREIRFVAEIGSWLGGTTVQLARALEGGGKVVAVDHFQWQHWMNSVVAPRKVGSNFLHEFSLSLSEYQISDKVIPHAVPLAGKWPLLHEHTLKFGLIYLDFTTDQSELEYAWEWLQPYLEAGKTVFVINMYGKMPFDFLIRHRDDLSPMFKPSTHAKAFLYKPADLIGARTPKVRVLAEPAWDHHCGGFREVIGELKELIHDPSAEVMFVPAVEDWLLERDLPNTSWIGICHQLPHSQTFWTLDLSRLVQDPIFLHSLKFCLGLFCLTQVGCDYLQSRLPSSVPVSMLPYAAPRSWLSQNIPWSPKKKSIRLLMVGGYARKFSDFVQIQLPGRQFSKTILLGEPGSLSENETSEARAANIEILPRVSNEKYRELLSTSLPFLSLESDGVASTLVTECAVANVPILVRRLTCIEQVLGADYPLFFNTLEQVPGLLKASKLQEALVYLKKLDARSTLTASTMATCLLKSAAFCQVSTTPTMSVDVSVVVATFKRTETLPEILTALACRQSYSGSYEIIVWNNNLDRSDEVRRICSCIMLPSHVRAVRVFNSSVNVYCFMRLALVPLIHGNEMLICDDDMIPSEYFVSTFMDSRKIFGKDVLLCLHGHKILPHTLNSADPAAAWKDRRCTQFIDDDEPTQHLQFLHADGCLISKHVLSCVASVKLPFPEVVLVDDYWISFVASYYFGYQIIKLQSPKNFLYTATNSAHDPSIALYLNPAVKQARMQLYVHHMLIGWPQQSSVITSVPTPRSHQPFIGFNIPFNLQKTDMEALVSSGITVVRLGAMCSGDNNEISDLAFLSPDCLGQVCPRDLSELVRYIGRLNSLGLKVILTLHRRIASPSLWRQIASKVSCHDGLVGYDLINEPYFAFESEHSVEELDSVYPSGTEIDKLVELYAEMARAVREKDSVTPIIVEGSAWGSWRGLRHLSREMLAKIEPCPKLLRVSFHMYEPQNLCIRRKNQGRYKYPGTVQKEMWDSTKINKLYDDLHALLSVKLGLQPFQILVGELGISRDTPGAASYLQDNIQAIQRQQWSVLLYAFREKAWNVMDYELGPNIANSCMDHTESNQIWTTLRPIFSNFQKDSSVK